MYYNLFKRSILVRGLQAGTAIVIVAIIIDRITQAFGQGGARGKKPLKQANIRLDSSLLNDRRKTGK